MFNINKLIPSKRKNRNLFLFQKPKTQDHLYLNFKIQLTCIYPHICKKKKIDFTQFKKKKLITFVLVAEEVREIEVEEVEDLAKAESPTL